MNTTATTNFEDKTVITGLVMLAISFIVFAATVNVFETNFDIFTGAFFFHYGLTVIYFFLVGFKNRVETGRFWKFPSLARNVILLQLFNISAYSLNRSMPVFQISTNWVVWFLLASNMLLLIHVLWRNYASNGLNHVLLIFANLGILFHFYESIFVFEIYPFGLLGFWFFGIPMHIFVPLFFVWTYVKVVRGFIKSANEYWTTTLVTWLAALALVGFVTFRFMQVNMAVEKVFHASYKPHADNNLPAWVKVSQDLKKDWITERALKTGLVYTGSGRRSFMNGRGMNERIKHDPLVVIASFFSGDFDIRHEDKIKILRYMYDARHQTERKLWSGENLSTSDIVTNVQLFPEYHIAYTEKTFKIHNSRVQRWRSQQEALYTFYLPEGSVVTSAALWVEGEERPAYLTTKGKADSAYQAIVGRERRDPLLLHWQEGNRVTVRVFPCTPEEDRQFKIGVTTPLQEKGEQLVYENIDFEGPYWKDANESINVVTEGQFLSNIDAPFLFSEEGTNYTYMGKYESDWKLAFDALPLSDAAFSFNGKSYQLTPHEAKETAFEAEEIYLDINAAWSKSTVDDIMEICADKKVYVYANHRMQALTKQNKWKLYKYLSDRNFTLFPFHKIKNPDRALVVSEFNQLTPTLSDLDKTGFVESISTFFKENESPIRLYNIGEAISPYLRTLKELRSIQLESGEVAELLSLLDKNTFLANQEDAQTIVNHYGKFQIKEGSGTAKNTTTAPDHLMRLFAYNNLLREVGKDYFNKKALEDDLIATAKEAYVVTPVSSLVVLETQKDYDRFDIKKSENSLQNASIGNSGAVPEPHEWLLIILVFLMTMYFYFKR